LKTETTGNGEALRYESIDDMKKLQPLETASAKNVKENSAYDRPVGMTKLQLVNSPTEQEPN